MKHTGLQQKILGLLLVCSMVGALMGLALLNGCAGLIGPREIDVPLSRLQNDINRRFPVNNRYLDVFDITLAQPRLSLDPVQNRVVFDLEVAIAPPLTSKRLSAALALSGGLRIDNARHALMLTDPKVEKLQVDGVDQVYSRQFSKLGSFIADRIFRETPVLRFKDEELRVAGVQFVPTAINVRQQSLVISVEPVK